MGREPQIEMIVGRAKTVLVFAGQATPVATITAILARWEQTPSEQGVVFSGPVRFADDTQRHLRTTVLPLVLRLCQSLGLALGSFEVSAVNLAAASHLDLGLEISGFSADLPLFLALISARLGLPVPQDLVCTGHIASADGDVRMVQSLAAKLDAVRTDKSIQRILLPGPDADSSLASLAANTRAEVVAATARARQEQRVSYVRNVADLLAAVFSEEAIISAALSGGYFGRRKATAANGAPVQNAADFLAGSRQRFYDALDAVLMAGNGKLARRLLRGWADLHIARKRYPREFGQTLAGILQSLPPAGLRTELTWPLLPVSSCIALSQHALPRDARDVPELYEAVSKPPQLQARARPPERAAPPPAESQPPSLLQSLLAEIDPEHLAATVGLPIDTARACFTLKAAVIEDQEKILDAVTAFHIHVVRRTGCAPKKIDRNQATADAYTLLERAFARVGGARAAIAEARTGIRGGMRFVLDQMTEQYKKDRIEKHVSDAVSAALDPLDPMARVALMREFFERFPGAVPPELADQPPERYAKRSDLIVRAYVDSMEPVKRMLRAL